MLRWVTRGVGMLNLSNLWCCWDDWFTLVRAIDISADENRGDAGIETQMTLSLWFSEVGMNTGLERGGPGVSTPERFKLGI